MTCIFHWFFMWKMDPMSGCDIRLVSTLPPKDSTLQYKRCVHLWNNFPCIKTLTWTETWNRTQYSILSGSPELYSYTCKDKMERFKLIHYFKIFIENLLLLSCRNFKLLFRHKPMIKLNVNRPLNQFLAALKPRSKCISRIKLCTAK